jgi:hypothetical protein
MVFAAAAAGETVDLTTAGTSGTINDAIYQQVSLQSTGTGVIDPFVQISSAGNLNETEAYNTTVNNVLNNGSSDQFNHSIMLSEVFLVDIDGTSYRRFLLDIGESSGLGDSFLSLDEVQIFVGGTANTNVTSFTDGILDHDGDLVYRMDAGEDSWVALDASLNAGSGSGDMFLFVPELLFAGYLGSDILTLYSHFGGAGVNPEGFVGNFGTSGAFEEWANLSDFVVPEPATLSLVGLGLAVLMTRHVTKRRHFTGR